MTVDPRDFDGAKCDVDACPRPAVILIVFTSGGAYPYCGPHGGPHVHRADVQLYALGR